MLDKVWFWWVCVRKAEGLASLLDLWKRKRAKEKLWWLFFYYYFIVVHLQLSAFSPHPSTPPKSNPPPSPASTLPLGFVHVSFIVVPEKLWWLFAFPLHLGIATCRTRWRDLVYVHTEGTHALPQKAVQSMSIATRGSLWSFQRILWIVANSFQIYHSMHYNKVIRFVFLFYAKPVTIICCHYR